LNHSADASPAEPSANWMSAVGIANEAGGKAVPSLNMPLPAISKPLTETELKEQNMLLARVIASSNNHWATLRQLLDRNASSIIVEGIAAEHSRAAREEAAKKLIMNHIAVLNDVTNPAPLTQESLRRVPRALAPYVDEGMREVARRLLGRRGGMPEALLLDSLLEVKLDPTNPQMVQAWSMMAEYLDKRLHWKPEQMPTRKPDMIPEEGEAMRDVLKEVGVGVSYRGGVFPGMMLASAVEVSVVETKPKAGGGVVS